MRDRFSIIVLTAAVQQLFDAPRLKFHCNENAAHRKVEPVCANVRVTRRPLVFHVGPSVRSRLLFADRPRAQRPAATDLPERRCSRANAPPAFPSTSRIRGNRLWIALAKGTISIQRNRDNPGSADESPHDRCGTIAAPEQRTLPSVTCPRAPLRPYSFSRKSRRREGDLLSRSPAVPLRRSPS